MALYDASLSERPGHVVPSHTVRVMPPVEFDLRDTCYDC